MFVAAAALVALVGVVLWVRFAWFFLSGEGDGHIQSLILGATLFIVAVQLARARRWSATSSPAAACSSSGSSSASGGWSSSSASSPRTTSPAPDEGEREATTGAQAGAATGKPGTPEDPADPAREAVKL